MQQIKTVNTKKLHDSCATVTVCFYANDFISDIKTNVANLCQYKTGRVSSEIYNTGSKYTAVCIVLYLLQSVLQSEKVLFIVNVNEQPPVSIMQLAKSEKCTHCYVCCKHAYSYLSHSSPKIV